MKLPLLILFSVLIFWVCTIYAEENVNSTGDVTNSDEEYALNYQYAPLETSLSRHKRSLMSPFLNIVMQIFGKSTALMLKPAFDIFKFTYGTLIGKIECPKVEKLSLNLITKIASNPVGTIQTALCYVMNTVGSQGRALMRKGFEIGLEFTKRKLIPGLYTFLNKMKGTGMLPPSIVALIDMFNAGYKIAKFMGYVG